MQNGRDKHMGNDSSTSETTLFAGYSDYGYRRVVEQHGIRKLLFGKGSDAEEDTALLLAEPDVSIFEYPRLMLCGLLLRPATRRVLLVGLGGGFLPAIIRRHRPDIHVTVVELDPLVGSLAKEFFDYRPDSANPLVIQDARTFLENSRDNFDQIWLDAFDGEGIPVHLATYEFLELCKARLVSGGVLAQNLHVGHSRYFSHLATATEVFESFYLLKGPSNENSMLFAVKGVTQPEPPKKAFARGLKLHGHWLGGIHLKAEAAKAVCTYHKDRRAVLYDKDI
ncbi:fused MFS/spermidine synthase [Desulfovibrio sp. OttesenSCG-928-C06]|nr:fused MFS/spermidine synthase [Desulfovibrio sp. OttesenSCG-928-C06]